MPRPKYSGTLVRVDGSTEARSLIFSEISKAIDCDCLEIVRTNDRRRMFVDESGLIHDKDENAQATKLYGNGNGTIVGDVFIVTEAEFQRVERELSAVDKSF